MSHLKNLAKLHFPFFLLILCAFFIIFTGLGDSALQVDEGEDTFISTTILKYGFPKHSDGVNHTMDVADINVGFFAYRPWFPYYLQAVSIFLFGKTTFAARLPFALNGIFSLCALYFLTLKLTQKRSTAFLAALFMTFSVPALLYFRTARYISLPISLTILLIIFYLGLYEKKEWSPTPFIITAVVFFHTMYVACAGAILGILIHFLIHQKETDRGNLKKVGFCAGVFALFTLPWLIMTMPVFDKVANFYSTTSDLIETSGLSYLKHFGAYLFQSNNYIFPLILTPLLFLSSLKIFRNQIQLLLICIFTLVATSTLNSIPLFQYITAAIPLFYILLAMIITEGFANARIKATLAIILIATNIIHVGPLLPVKTFFKTQEILLHKTDYLHGVHKTIMREITFFSLPYKYGYQLINKYKGPLDEVLAFFKTHGQPGELCYIDNETASFAYYTGMKVILKNELTARDKPDWVVLRGDLFHQLEGTAEKNATAFRLQQILSSNPYEKHVLNSGPSRLNNSYDIQMHSFEPLKDNGYILVYHLTNLARTNPT